MKILAFLKTAPEMEKDHLEKTSGAGTCPGGGQAINSGKPGGMALPLPRIHSAMLFEVEPCPNTFALENRIERLRPTK
jgi:hypothetical protein